MLSYNQLATIATSLGFTAFGCAPAGPVASWRATQWHDYLAAGRHADMHYLEQHLEKRLDPSILVEGAKSVVCVALNYFTEEEFIDGGYTISKYARGRDYHEVMKELLRAFLSKIAALTGNENPGRAFCDTAPVDEHYWAYRTGLGWLGRNTQLIIPQAGSYFFIGTLILTETVDRYCEPQPNRCGTCTKCIDACPTRALTASHGLDARRCLSYLTIEHRGELPEFAGKALAPCFYGCDRCQDVCPHNRFATATTCEAFHPAPNLLRQTPNDWHNLTEDSYKTLFKGSAVKRAKFDGLKRNIAAVQQSTTEDSR